MCLDGSRLAERMIPYARGVAAAANARLKLLRVVDWGESPTGVTQYLDAWAKLLDCEAQLLPVKDDVGATLLREFSAHPDDLSAVATRGHTGLIEPLLGSTAMKVVREIGRPILLMHPRLADGPQSFEMKSIVAALDGTSHSEEILPFAVATAKAAHVDCELVQTLPYSDIIPGESKGDVLEDSYLARCADRLKKRFDVNVMWEILHGQPASSICSYISDRPGVVLAMTSHIRTPLRHAVLGSVASECIRRSGVPTFIYGVAD
jgi:nucleotide-binding universal stress UspA family protein